MFFFVQIFAPIHSLDESKLVAKNSKSVCSDSVSIQSEEVKHIFSHFLEQMLFSFVTLFLAMCICVNLLFSESPAILVVCELRI